MFKQTEKALKDYSSAIDHGFVVAYPTRGIVYNTIGEHKKAQKDY